MLDLGVFIVYRDCSYMVASMKSGLNGSTAKTITPMPGSCLPSSVAAQTASQKNLKLSFKRPKSLVITVYS